MRKGFFAFHPPEFHASPQDNWTQFRQQVSQRLEFLKDVQSFLGMGGADSELPSIVHCEVEGRRKRVGELLKCFPFRGVGRVLRCIAGVLLQIVSTTPRLLEENSAC